MKNKLVLILILFVIALGTVSCDREETPAPTGGNPVTEEVPRVFEYETLSKAEARDKILGGWIGQAIGIGSGFEYVVSTNNVCESDGSPVDGYTVGDMTAIVALADKYWEPDGEICAGSIGSNPLGVRPVNDPRVVRGVVYSDDDMHVDVLNQFIFRDYGPVLGNNDIASAWEFYDVHDVGGGADTRNLVLNSSLIPPYTGQSTYGSMGYWVTESWIENETLGMLFPYMYDLAEGYADMFTQVQGDAYAYYLGKLCAIMTSLAYEYDDAKTIVDKAFEVMGKSNEIYEIYQYVLKCYNQGISWRQACIGIVEKSVNCAKIKLSDTAGFSINANAGMIFLGMIYGQNDFEESMKITSLAGLDGDCTAATVGCILGVMLGFDNLPEKYKNFLNGESIYYNHMGTNGLVTGAYWPAFAYMGKNFPNSMTFNWLTDLTLSNLENVVTAYHGSSDGEKFTIAKRDLIPTVSVDVKNYSFESGTTDGWKFLANDGSTSFVASSAGTHIGKQGGVLMLGDSTSTAKVYQDLKLVEGHYYKASIWINGSTDREFKLYAANGEDLQFKSYVNPVSLSNRHMKAEMIFKATAETMSVGVDFCKTFEDAYSTTIGIDDFFVEDVTRYISNRDIQSFEAEDCTLNGTAQVVASDSYSNGKATYLSSDDSISTSFTSNGQIQSFKVYYDNKAAFVASLAIYVDDEFVCNLPIVSTGVSNYYNTSNYAELQMYFAPGTHTITISYLSFDDVYLDKILISNGNKLLEV